MTLDEIEAERLLRRLAAKARLEEEDLLRAVIRFVPLPEDRERAKGAAFSLPADFSYPTCFSGRPISSSGKTTFHFSMIKISKRPTYGDDTRPFVCEITSGAAGGAEADVAGHDDYITQPDAVMAACASDYGEYIESGAPGEHAIVSNISYDPAIRERFWRAVVETERQPSQDTVKLNPSAIPEHLRDEAIELLLKVKVLRSEDRQRLESIRSREGAQTDQVDIVLPRQDFYRLREFLKKKKAWDKAIAVPCLGRGGRVQFRFVCEIPDGLDHAARLRIMLAFAAFLRRKGFMFTVVIHEPDAQNDEKNFHLHAVAYDRKCEYIEEKSSWDFEPSVDGQGGRTRKHAPDRKTKSKWVSQPQDGQSLSEHGTDVLTTFRTTYAEICNQELKQVGLNKLYHPGSFEDLGIEQEPGEHLGTKVAAMEAAGVPTKKGVENARRSWQGELDREMAALRKLQKQRMESLEEAARYFRSPAYEVSAPQKVEKLRAQATELRTLVEEIGRTEDLLVLLRLTLSMAQSRSGKTKEKCDRLLHGFKDKGRKSASSEAQRIERRRQEAEAYARSIEVEFANAIEQVEEFVPHAEAARARMAELVHEITATILALREDTGALLGDQAKTPTVSEGTEPRRYTVRERRQIDEYARDPNAFLQAWNAVFSRIEREGLRIASPSTENELFRVYGLEKNEFDKLKHPILQARSQGRLKDIFERRERARSGSSRDCEVPACDGKQPTTEREIAQTPNSDDGPWEKLRSQALADAERDRAKAIEEFLGSAPLPVEFVDGQLRMIRAKSPECDREPLGPSSTFAFHMADVLEPIVMERAKTALAKVEQLLQTDRKNLIVDNGTFFRVCTHNMPSSLAAQWSWLKDVPSIIAMIGDRDLGKSQTGLGSEELHQARPEDRERGDTTPIQPSKNQSNEQPKVSSDLPVKVVSPPTETPEEEADRLMREAFLARAIGHGI